MIACCRWVLSAATVSWSAGLVVVKKAWNRQVSNRVALSGGLLLVGVGVGDAAHHQPSGYLFGGGPGGERGVADLGDLRGRDPRAGLLVAGGVRVPDRGPPVVADRGDRLLDPGIEPDGDRHLGAGP